MSFYNTSQQLQAADRLLARAGELTAQGRLAEAEGLYHESLKNIVNLYGAKSLKACSCLLELAEIYYCNDQYAEVITLLEQVLVTNRDERIFTDEKLLAIKFKLGKALEKSGNAKQAGQCYAEVLTDAKIVCGPTSPFTKTVAECTRALAKRTGCGPHVEGVEIRQRQSQTGPLICSQSSARWQYDTSQIERLVQSTSMNMSEIARQKTALPEDGPDTGITPLTRQVPKTRAYVTGTETAPKSFRRHLRSIITIPVACFLVLWLFISGVLDDKKTTSANNAEAPGARASAAFNPSSLAEYAGHYSSTDGVKQFEVQDGGKGVLSLGQDSELVKVSKLAAEIYAESEDTRVSFRPTGNCLVDGQGVKLYKRGSPELGVVASARQLADVFNSYYARYGKYPRSQMSLQTAGVSYHNALTLRPTQPKLMALSPDSAGSSMTLSDYQNANWMAANLMAMNGAMGEPGGIEVHVFPVSSLGETVFIRGFDRDGQLLPSSTAGRCFSVVLVAGRVSR